MLYCRVPRTNHVGPETQRRHYALSLRLSDRDDALSTDLGSEIFLGAFLGVGNDILRGGPEPSAVCAGNPVAGDQSDSGAGCTGTSDLSSDVRRQQFDLLVGGRGNDLLLGDDDQDSLDGGPGNDGLFGGAGDDQVIGASGNDALYGQAGNDRLDNPLVALEGARQQAFVAGNDFLDGGPDTDVVGYRWMRQPVRASSAGATIGTSNDTFRAVEIVDLSKANDVFDRGGGNSLIVNGLEGDDRITVSGNPSPEFNDRVYCGPGRDSVSIDVNHVETDGDGASGRGEIMEDGNYDCENVARVSR